jgi:selenocysteine lyase/cysteine desulfurase
LALVQNGVYKGNGEMRKDLAIKKNLDLLNEFMKFAFESPEILERIPVEAELVILPIDDQELYKYNEDLANKLFSQGKNVVLVKMKKPEVSIPQLELMLTGTA